MELIFKLQQKTLFWILIILFASLPIILPLTQNGYFQSQDGQWAVIRLAEMNREVKDMQIPPRWSDFLNHGVGYPLFQFTYPFPYYIGEIIHIFGAGLIDSVKTVFLLSVVLSGIFMFYLGKKINGSLAGTIAAILYIYAPFHIVDLYVRGSIGESVAFVLFPLIFLLTLNLVTSPKLSNILLLSLSFSALVLTHNILALLFFPFWIAFIFVAVRMYSEDLKHYILSYFLPSILLGLGLSAYFWIPAILEKKYIALSIIPLADKTANFLNLSSFINSPWSYNSPSFQLGWVHLTLFIVEIVIFFLLKGLEGKKLIYIGIYTAISILVAIFMMTPLSILIWKLPLLSSIDFPWRLMPLLVFFMSIQSVYLVEKKAARIFTLILLILSFFLVGNFARPVSYISTNDSYYETNDATTTSADELMPVFVREKTANRPQNKVDILIGNGNINNPIYNSFSLRFDADLKSQTKIGINTVYFPGWVIYSNGQKIDPDYSNSHGLMTFDLPPGNFQINAQFTRTPVRLYADIISLVSIILASGMGLYTLAIVLKRRI